MKGSVILKAKKLPSGSWRCRVFDHYEYDETGKRKQVNRSFTAPTKREAERMASEWMYGKRLPSSSKTVQQAVSEYIASKESVLSPSTIRSYRSMERDAFHLIGHLNISTISPAVVQKWVNQLARVNTPKTVRNKYALLAATYEMYTGERLTVTLPARIRPDLHTPSTEDVKKLIAFLEAKPSRETLLIAVMLASLCSLRRGEICALTADDIRDGRIYVSRSMVETSEHGVTTKQPKTYSGYRIVKAPDSLLRRLEGKDGRIVPLTPNALTDRFRRAVLACFGEPNYFRLHDLRHFYVSFAHAAGIPDKYIQESGGWKTSQFMRRVYLDALTDEKKKQEDLLVERLEEVVS